MAFEIENIKKKMLVKYPFFGSVITNVDYEEKKEISTASTDGKTIYYNPDFLNDLSNEQQVFVFAHETCHIALNHILRSEGKNSKLWNIATDAVINALLRKDGLPLIENCVNIEDALNYNAEELYEKLLKEQQNSNQNQGEQSQDKENTGEANNNFAGNNADNSNQENDNFEKENNNSQLNDSNDTIEKSDDEKSSGDNSTENTKNNEVGHDDHSMWEEAVKENNSNKNKSEQEKKLQEEIGKTSKYNEQDAFSENRKEKKRELEKLKESLFETIMNYGNSTNSNLREIGDVGKSKSLIDWRYILREAITRNVDWSYQNAFIEDGFLKVNLEEIPVSETEIVLDTSGSIDENLLRNFLRECKNILASSVIKVGCFDTKFYGFTEIRNISDIDNMHFIGGGGTNFDVAINAFSKRVENKIIFTDGRADMPKGKVNVIWIVFGNHKINPVGGKVIYVSEEKLRELNRGRNR